MRNFRNIQVAVDTPIRRTIEIIDASAMQIALVVDDSGRLVGTVTDGDIRRGILKGIPLDGAVREVMNCRPTVCRPDDDRESLLTRMKAKGLHHIPVVDDRGVLLGLEFLDEFLAPQARDNAVILMAGGLGVRLRPLTEDCPKPMLKIGGRPILETILLNFMESGFETFYFSVNYKSEIITDHFGDGSKWGVTIDYLHESEKLGTAGALSLLRNRPSAPLLVMNGDLLTKVNFGQLLDFHKSHDAKATMCIREYDFQVPYGVVRIDNHRIIGIDEKPIQKFFVNAGIYVLEPEALDFIPKNTYFDMPTLFEKLIGAGMGVSAFPIREYWLDIGHLADYDRAKGDYGDIFS
ncbi:MAG: nucleotidyltransferase family protein [Betaproteobacteria bacterium]|nr:nucleotidyltransferase family protein [Betaproteobacteria bacterium]